MHDRTKQYMIYAVACVGGLLVDFVISVIIMIVFKIIVGFFIISIPFRAVGGATIDV